MTPGNTDYLLITTKLMEGHRQPIVCDIRSSFREALAALTITIQSGDSFLKPSGFVEGGT